MNFPVIRLANILQDYKHKLGLIENCHGMNYMRLFKTFIQQTERDDILCNFSRLFHDNPQVDVMAWYKKCGSTGTYIPLPEPILDRLSHQYMLIFYGTQPDRIDLRNFSAIHFPGAHLEEKLWRLKKLTVFPFVYGMQHAMDKICERLPESGSAPLMQLFHEVLPEVDAFVTEWARKEELEEGEEDDADDAPATDLLDLVSAVAKGEDPSSLALQAAPLQAEVPSPEEEAPLAEAAPPPPEEAPLAEEAAPPHPSEERPRAVAPSRVSQMATPSAETVREPAAQDDAEMPRCFDRQDAALKVQLEALWNYIGRAGLDARLREDLRIDLEILGLEMGKRNARRERARAILDDIGRAFVPDPLKEMASLLQD